MTNHNTTQSEGGGAAAPVTFVYSVNQEVADLLRVAEGLRARGIVMLPSVRSGQWGTDASAWESPNDCVAVKTRKTGDYRPRTVMFPGEYASLDEYIDALARAVLGEPDQCMADGCFKSEDGNGSGYCSAACFEVSEPQDEDAEAKEICEQITPTGWTVRLSNGLLTGYPSWQRAAIVARQFPPHMVLRISGPDGTVPLVGHSLDRALEGGA